MKKIIISVLGILIMSFLCLCGCEEKLPNNIKFFEFPQFNQFNEDIVAIDVAWDDNESQPIRFSINETEKINNIISMYKETTFVKVDSASDGNHSSITLTDKDGNSVLISLSNIKYGDKQQYYKYPDNNIYDYIKLIGQNLGALS